MRLFDFLRTNRFGMTGAALWAASFALADAQDISQKFLLTGDTLVYDTENADPEAEIESEDAARLLEILRENPQVTTLELNSSGGSVYGGNEMARIVVDFGLDTVVAGECVSACVTLFLAGNARRMMLGSKIGFHQYSWSPDSMRNYFENWAESSGWNDPYDFASWVYEDTQSEVFDDLTYMINRGVDPVFAIQTKSIDPDDEWFPSRVELTEAGVLRD